jgi:hypothetical protein
MKTIIRNLRKIRLALLAKLNYETVNMFSEKSEKRFYTAAAIYTALFFAIQVFRLIHERIINT